MFSIPAKNNTEAKKHGKIEISFEMFPPVNEASKENLIEVAQRLDDFQPSFVSVTYGAGGGTQKRTLDALAHISSHTGHELAGHLTCVGASKEETNAVAAKYHDMGVKRIVALRGDTPKGQDKYSPHPQGYENAADLVAGLKQLGGFDISVAAYPEAHPDSPSQKADLDNLKAKFDAGANRAITQFFFDNHLYLDFIKAAREHGISGPIVPGILLIHDFEKMKKFAAMCHTSVPAWLEERFDGTQDNKQAHMQAAVQTAVEQVKELAENGVDHFHFYTMNKSELVVEVCKQLDLSVDKDIRSVA